MSNAPYRIERTFERICPKVLGIPGWEARVDEACVELSRTPFPRELGHEQMRVEAHRITIRIGSEDVEIWYAVFPRAGRIRTLEICTAPLWRKVKERLKDLLRYAPGSEKG